MKTIAKVALGLGGLAALAALSKGAGESAPDRATGPSAPPPLPPPRVPAPPAGAPPVMTSTVSTSRVYLPATRADATRVIDIASKTPVWATTALVDVFAYVGGAHPSDGNVSWPYMRGMARSYRASFVAPGLAVVRGTAAWGDLATDDVFSAIDVWTDDARELHVSFTLRLVGVPARVVVRTAYANLP